MGGEAGERHRHRPEERGPADGGRHVLRLHVPAAPRHEAPRGDRRRLLARAVGRPGREAPRGADRDRPRRDDERRVGRDRPGPARGEGREGREGRAGPGPGRGGAGDERRRRGEEGAARGLRRRRLRLERRPPQRRQLVPGERGGQLDDGARGARLDPAQVDGPGGRDDDAGRHRPDHPRGGRRPPAPGRRARGRDLLQEAPLGGRPAVSTRKLLVLTGVFLALLAFVVFFERHQPTSEQAARARKKLLDFETAEAVAVTVERPDLPKVALARGPEDRWLVGGEPADAATVDGLVADLARLDLVGETRTEFDPKEFGLDAPKATVVLGLKGGASHTVLFGSEVPGTDATAAAVGGRFGAVKYAPMAALRKPLDDFRSKNLVEVPSADVTRMTIAKGTSRIVVARSAGTAGSPPGDWRLEEPVKDLASRTFVDELLADLSSSRVSEFPTLGPSDLPRVGLAPPSATVTLQKGDQVVASLAFGATKADVAGKLYALRGKTPVVVDDRVQEGIAKELSAFRETKICPLDTWNATRLSVDLGGTVGGAEKVEGEWRSGGRTVPATAVEDLLERLSRIEA
ncbi:DUF4340 domain-containing protein, partial [Acidobacteria bacterium ACD]|nr:DUF4340 domain-containing protein [Acidobacteria bacterium ACD]